MEHYQQRLSALISYIDENLSDTLTLAVLSQQAAISPFHLHRLFSAYTKQPLKQFIKQRRLNRAAYQIYLRQMPVTEIAFDAGYHTLESFSRAFKTQFSQTPSAYRVTPSIKPWITSTLQCKGTNNMQNFNLNDVEIVEFPSINLATFRHQGSPNNLMASVQHFIEWRRQFHTPPGQSRTFNLLYSDPKQTAADEFIFDIAAETKQQVAVNDYQIFNQIIPTLKCAELTVQGGDDSLEPALTFLYTTWLQHSREQVADHPCIVERITMYPDVPMHLATLKIYLPLI